MKLPYGYVLIGGEIVVHEEKADVMAAPNKGNFCGVRNPRQVLRWQGLPGVFRLYADSDLFCALSAGGSTHPMSL